MNTLLITKQKYTSILGNINALIDSYLELDIILKYNINPNNGNQNNGNQIKNINLNFLSNLEKERNEIILLIKDIEDKIYNLCEHQFVDDYIDIYPDDQLKITYCQICESNKK